MNKTTQYDAVIVFGFLLAFLLCKFLMHLLFVLASPELGYGLFVGGLACFALLACRVQTASNPQIFRRFAGATALGMVVYLTLEPTTYVVANPSLKSLASVIRIMDFIAIGAAILSVRRLAFLAVPAAHILAARAVVKDISGFEMATHDIRYLAEAGLFFAFSGVLLAFVRKKPSMTLDRETHISTAFAFMVIGFHLANYFWSGIAKITLDDGMFEWLLHNDLSQMYVVSLEKGTAPLGEVPVIVNFMAQTLSQFSVAFNANILLLQLLSVALCCRLFALRIATVLFDVFHIGVYLVGGILFWPWMWTNGAVLWALHRVREVQITPLVKTAGVVALLAAGLPYVGGASKLGWYDIADTRMTVVEAQARGTDTWIPVPSSFMGAHAYTVSHGRLNAAEQAGHYPYDSVGLTYNAQWHRQNGTCQPFSMNRPLETTVQRERRFKTFDNFIRARHHAALKEQARWGKYFYYYRLHHHPSNPIFFAAFHQLPLEEIARYRMVTRSLCLRLENGHLKRHILKEDVHVTTIP